MPYIVFSFLAESLLAPDLLSRDSDPLVPRVFDFLETMASSSDGNVVTLLWVGLFEVWAADFEKFEQAFAHMGPRTKALAQNAAKEFHLPEI